MKFVSRFSLLLASCLPTIFTHADYASTVAGFNPPAWWRFSETNPTTELTTTVPEDGASAVFLSRPARVDVN